MNGISMDSSKQQIELKTGDYVRYDSGQETRDGKICDVKVIQGVVSYQVQFLGLHKSMDLWLPATSLTRCDGHDVRREEAVDLSPPMNTKSPGKAVVEYRKPRPLVAQFRPVGDTTSTESTIQTAISPHNYRKQASPIRTPHNPSLFTININCGPSQFRLLYPRTLSFDDSQDSLSDIENQKSKPPKKVRFFLTKEERFILSKEDTRQDSVVTYRKPGSPDKTNRDLNFAISDFEKETGKYAVILLERLACDVSPSSNVPHNIQGQTLGHKEKFGSETSTMPKASKKCRTSKVSETSKTSKPPRTSIKSNQKLPSSDYSLSEESHKMPGETSSQVIANKSGTDNSLNQSAHSSLLNKSVDKQNQTKKTEKPTNQNTLKASKISKTSKETGTNISNENERQNAVVTYRKPGSPVLTNQYLNFAISDFEKETGKYAVILLERLTCDISPSRNVPYKTQGQTLGHKEKFESETSTMPKASKKCRTSKVSETSKTSKPPRTSIKSNQKLPSSDYSLSEESHKMPGETSSQVIATKSGTDNLLNQSLLNQSLLNKSVDKQNQTKKSEKPTNQKTLKASKISKTSKETGTNISNENERQNAVVTYRKPGSPVLTNQYLNFAISDFEKETGKYAVILLERLTCDISPSRNVPYKTQGQTLGHKEKFESETSTMPKASKKCRTSKVSETSKTSKPPRISIKSNQKLPSSDYSLSEESHKMPGETSSQVIATKSGTDNLLNQSLLNQSLLNKSVDKQNQTKKTEKPTNQNTLKASKISKTSKETGTNISNENERQNAIVTYRKPGSPVLTNQYLNFAISDFEKETGKYAVILLERLTCDISPSSNVTYKTQGQTLGQKENFGSKASKLPKASKKCKSSKVSETSKTSKPPRTTIKSILKQQTLSFDDSRHSLSDTEKERSKTPKKVCFNLPSEEKRQDSVVTYRNPGRSCIINHDLNFAINDSLSEESHKMPGESSTEEPTSHEDLSPVSCSSTSPLKIGRRFSNMLSPMNVSEIRSSISFHDVIDSGDEAEISHINDGLQFNHETEESSSPHEPPLVINRGFARTIIPQVLRLWLTVDYEYINLQHKIIKLPARMTVNHILAKYSDYRHSFGYSTAEEESEVNSMIRSLRYYFNTKLRSHLLYQFEVLQYEKVIVTLPHIDKSAIYGGIHLLRLINKIEVILDEENVDPDLRERFYVHLEDFIRIFDQYNTKLLSLTDYRTPHILYTQAARA